ncbi:MAG: ADP-ribosylation factor-like protein [Candidatus Odinarchaeota archaeon]
MFENKKIIIVGPSGTGKTTIKKVFFEMGNPLKFLNTGLEPTRGIDSKIYSFFDINLGVFDLAGQENENWFKNDKKIFNNANVIICVLDVNAYLKEILDFIRNLINIYKDLKLSNCIIAVLLHKIDLIDKLHLHHKLKAIHDFVEKLRNNDIELLIFPTSIAKEYFLETYDSISEIINKIVKHKNFSRNKSIFQDFRIDLEIIFNYDVQKQYKIQELFYDLNLSFKEAVSRLNGLKELGFIELLESSKVFQLTEKVNFFKFGLKQKNINENQIKINKILESLFYFSNLKKK